MDDRPSLTLLHGSAQATYTEHPFETARRALVAAAAIEPEWSAVLVRFARALPHRAPPTRLEASSPALQAG